jgi:hypothetical protein
MEGGGALTYLFDLQGELRDFSPAAELAYLHDRLTEQGQLDHRMSAGEIACLGRVLSLDFVPDGNDPRWRDAWPQCEHGLPR